MATATSERGLERLTCTALTGHACDPPKPGYVWAVLGTASLRLFGAIVGARRKSHKMC